MTLGSGEFGGCSRRSQPTTFLASFAALPLCTRRVVFQHEAVVMHLDHPTVAFRKRSINDVCVRFSDESWTTSLPANHDAWVFVPSRLGPDQVGLVAFPKSSPKHHTIPITGILHVEMCPPKLGSRSFGPCDQPWLCHLDACFVREEH